MMREEPLRLVRGLLPFTSTVNPLIVARSPPPRIVALPSLKLGCAGSEYGGGRNTALRRLT